MSHSWLNTLGRNIKTNTPAILTGAAIVGLVGTVVLAVKATPEACEAIAEAKEEKNLDVVLEISSPADEMKLTPQEIVLATWRFYIPAGVSFTATLLCIVGSCTVGYRQKAAIAGAYALVDQNFRMYKDKVIEQITPQKADKIEDEVNKERLHRSSSANKEVVVLGQGEVLCMDSLSGRCFKSSVEDIRRAVNDVNEIILTDMYCAQNAFYERVGLPPTTLGEEMGWNIDNKCEIHLSTLLNECDQPVLVVGFKRLPIAGYYKL